MENNNQNDVLSESVPPPTKDFISLEIQNKSTTLNPPFSNENGAHIQNSNIFKDSESFSISPMTFQESNELNTNLNANNIIHFQGIPFLKDYSRDSQHSLDTLDTHDIMESEVLIQSTSTVPTDDIIMLDTLQDGNAIYENSKDININKDIPLTRSFSSLSYGSKFSQLSKNSKYSKRSKKSKKNKKPVKVTPLPWAYISIVFIMYTTDLLAITSLTPYLPFLVESFGLVRERWMLGYIAGFIASSYYFAQFFSSFFWGSLSDRFGRRPVMLSGLIASCICTFAFGFSKSLPWALTCRLLYGAFNGNLGVMKTFLAEMTDKTNQGKAFAYIGLSFGIGQVIGPIIGGYLSQPVENFPNLFTINSPLYILKGFFEYFPFFLPNFFISTTIAIALFISFFFLKESNRSILKKSASTLSLNSINNANTNSIGVSRSSSFIRSDSLNDLKRINSNDIELKDVPLSPTSPFTKEFDNTTESSFQLDLQAIPEKKSLFKRIRSSEIIASSPPLLTVFIYTCLGINSVLFSEILPLWAILSPKRWGISFNSNDLGLAFTISGVMIFIFNLFIVHKLISKIGLLNTLKIGSLLGIPFTLLFPEVSLFINLKYGTLLIWISLMTLILIRQVTSQMQFTPIMILINNSVSYESMGTLNGISQSCVALSRAIGPTLGGILFAMSSNNDFFPFDVHLVFLLMTLDNVLCLFLSFLLPNSISHPKSESQETIHEIMME